MKKYELSLSKSDFDKMAKEIENLKANLSKAKEMILNALAEYTKERVQYYIKMSTDFSINYTPTGELLNSIMISDIVQDTIKVYTDNAYAIYVEYGTGIVGSLNPHPDTEGWEYGSEGWVYKGNDGNYYYTEGQYAHKFMYNAFQDLKKNYLQISKKALEEGGII